MYIRDLQEAVFKKMYLIYVGYNPWGRKESDTTEQLTHTHSLEGLMLKLKLQDFGRLVGRAESLGKILLLQRLKAKREVYKRGWDVLIASLTQWTWIRANSGSCGGLRSLVCCGPWGLKSQTQLSNWTTIVNKMIK